MVIMVMMVISDNDSGKDIVVVVLNRDNKS